MTSGPRSSTPPLTGDQRPTHCAGDIRGLSVPLWYAQRILAADIVAPATQLTRWSALRFPKLDVQTGAHECARPAGRVAPDWLHHLNP
jgi:hypothetical protein